MSKVAVLPRPDTHGESEHLSLHPDELRTFFSFSDAFLFTHPLIFNSLADQWIIANYGTDILSPENADSLTRLGQHLQNQKIIELEIISGLSKELAELFLQKKQIVLTEFFHRGPESVAHDSLAIFGRTVEGIGFLIRSDRISNPRAQKNQPAFAYNPEISAYVDQRMPFVSAFLFHDDTYTAFIPGRKTTTHPTDADLTYDAVLSFFRDRTDFHSITVTHMSFKSATRKDLPFELSRYLPNWEP